MAGRILIVAGDERLRTALCRGLQGQSVEADELRDGSRAVEAIRSGRYSILLLDLAAPAIDGFQVLREIGADANRPTIIALSANPSEVEKLASNTAVTMSIDKQFALENLDAVIGAAAALSRMP